MDSYEKVKADLLNSSDYRSFIYRSTRLPQMMDSEIEYLGKVQEHFKEEGFNHLSVVEICRTLIRVEILKLSLMQSTHGIYVNNNLQYPEEEETLERFTLEKQEQDFYQLKLPENLEEINQGVRNKVITFNQTIEPILKTMEQNVGDVNDTVKVVVGELMDSNPHILSKIYDETYYDIVFKYNINNAFEAAWKKQLIQTPLVSFFSVLTLSYYDDMFKEQLM